VRLDSHTAVYIVFAVCILVAAGINLHLRENIRQREHFSALYFSRPDSIPGQVLINSSYNVSFTIVNHEAGVTRYVYEIESDVQRLRGNISLVPGGRAIISLQFTPSEKNWELNMSVSEHVTERLEVLSEVVVGRDNEFNVIIDNRSLKSYLPLSYSLPGFGYVFHTNVSVDDLRISPVNKSVQFEMMGMNSSVVRGENVSLYYENESIFLSSTKYEKIFFVEDAPFVVKLVKDVIDLGGQKDAETEEEMIYFWYEVAG